MYIMVSLYVYACVHITEIKNFKNKNYAYLTNGYKQANNPIWKHRKLLSALLNAKTSSISPKDLLKDFNLERNQQPLHL